MATATAIKGRKGGSASSRTPVEQPDDLQSIAKAKILIALGEGEFAGGLSDQTIFLDGTPLKNSDGSNNFSGVSWDFRPGTQAQTYIQGMPGTENEVSIGTEIKSATAWSHTFTNTQLSAIRLRLKWPSLFNQEDDGDLVGHSIKYAIDLQTDGGSFVTVVDTAVTGKTTSGYERSHRIDLPQAGSTWTVRLRRLTQNANSAKIGDAMTLQSYTEVIDAKLRYPNTALLYVEFDSSQFNGSIPQISCEPRGRVMRVPDNYNPETREYTGSWGGVFKWAWTDNPAWVFYDIVISDRFGLGNRLTPANVDRWELYRVAQYCDQQVPDGKGGSGTEPRYKCDVYVQQRNDAYTVLRDFAAIFRGMTCWSGNQIIALADMPRDVDFNYTRANVIDGDIFYSSSTTKTRYTTALVSWTDPDNGYANAMEPAFVGELVSRYGYNQLELTAIGCTRQSEAHRKGLWGILTNNKDRVATFSVGLDGMIPQPGHIISIADERLSGKVTGGRISSVNGRAITLDRDPYAKPGDRLILNLPSGAAQSRTIQTVSGGVVTVTASYSEIPESESVWVVESDELYAQQYRVVSIANNNDNTLTISASYHDPDKYARIDAGAIIDERPISVVPPGSQGAPTDIEIEAYSVVNQGISVQTMRSSWAETANAISYEAQWRRNEGNWISVPRGSTASFEVAGIYSGRYVVRVRAINAAEISSAWGYSDEVTLSGKVGNPPKPVGLSATGINWGVKIDWDFPENSSDSLKTEIQYSVNSDYSNPLLLSDVPYPQSEYTQLGLKAGQTCWYRAQLVDKSGNESGYTEWIRGMANANAEDYIGDIDDAIRDSGTFNNLKDGINEKIDKNLEAILNNALGYNGAVDRQYEQNGRVSAEIITIRTTIASVDSALAQLTTSVRASFNDVNAQILQQQTATSNNTGAISSLDTYVKSEFNGVKSQIQQQQTAISNNTGAISKLDTYVQSEFNNVTAAVNQKLDASVTDNGTATAFYTTALGIIRNGVKYSAGLAMGIEPSGSSYKSTIAFNADQIGIYTGSNAGGYQMVFAAINGQAFLRSAFIQDGSIDNAKIGNYIQSNNYVVGKSGWNVNKDGSAEFNKVTVRGTVYASGGNFNNVTIEENCDVKGTIYANKIVGDVVSSGVWKKIGLQGVNGTQTRYFNGGLPYESTVVILSPGLKISGSVTSGRTQIWVNGVNIYDNLPKDLNSPIMFDVPANGSAKVEFVITGVSSSTFWTSDSDLVVMAFKKSENRFS